MNAIACLIKQNKTQNGSKMLALHQNTYLHCFPDSKQEIKTVVSNVPVGPGLLLSVTPVMQELS